MSVFLLCAATAVLPLLVPRGVWSTAPVDVFIASFVVFTALGFVAFSHPRRLPGGRILLVLLGLSLVSLAFGLDPLAGVRTILTELYLFAFFWLAVITMEKRPDAVRIVLATWVASSVVWALAMVGVYYEFLPEGLERLLVAYESSSRVSGASRNPNLAASYLVTSFFVLTASRWPAAKLLRVACGGCLLLALYVSGSNGAVLGLLVGLLVLAATRMMRGRPAAERLRVTAVMLLIGAASLIAVTFAFGSSVGRVDVEDIARRERSGVLGESVGRLDDSVTNRLTIWSLALDGGSARLLTGSGPGAAERIESEGVELGKELHNDYLSFLLERGVLGLVTFVALIVVVWRWCARSLRVGVEAATGRFWDATGLMAAFTANLTISLTHESFHFRHLWLLLALIYVTSSIDAARSRPRQDDAGRHHEPIETKEAFDARV